MLSLGTFKTGAILLAGLFVCDIFWVVFTPVMVSVAKSFDVPIKKFYRRCKELAFSPIGIYFKEILVTCCYDFNLKSGGGRTKIGLRTTKFRVGRPHRVCVEPKIGVCCDPTSCADKFLAQHVRT